MQRQLLPKPLKARAFALFRFFILNQHSKQNKNEALIIQRAVTFLLYRTQYIHTFKNTAETPPSPKKTKPKKLWNFPINELLYIVGVAGEL